ncbi:MAG: hypothetical protein WBR18_10035 [Anaerolineales bacterium]
MNSKQPIEDAIDRRLRSIGLSGISASLLEALAPLAPLAAQFAYLLEPMFVQDQRGWLTELASWLERPDNPEAMAQRLRERHP